jgi:tetratricopeptide (TPR) repeat protein
MMTLKKIIILVAIVVLGALDIFVYLNNHFYYRAQKEENIQKRIALLEKSNKYCPLNDLVFYELGKSYFDLGIGSLNDMAASASSFQKSAQNLKKSILINPASPFSHFYLAQSLLNLDLFSPGNETQFYSEFRKAALLAGDDSQIYNEVGRLFFSRWPGLSEEDRNFTLDILRKIMAKKDSKMIALILNIWELNAKDYEIMNEVLPPDPQICRQYAEFLGEKSLFLEERHKYLAQAEVLDFARARREFQSGEMELARFQTQQAFGLFKTSQHLLRGIKFYQTFVTEKDSINISEYTELLKFTWLNLAKCRIEERAGLSEVADDLNQYLALEGQTARVDELVAYLRDRGLIPEKIDKDFSDLPRLTFELLLQFKQTKYRDIINFGRELQGSLVVVPGANKPDYVRMLLLVGDSLQKVDFLYDAGDIYQKALEINPNNLGTLLRIRQNYDRLNEERKLGEINKAIEKLEAPHEIDFQNLLLNKGITFSRSLVLDGQKIALDLQFRNNEERQEPLISVFFNNRVVWDEYLKNGVISLSLETKPGENTLQIVPVNQSVSLAKLTYRLSIGNMNLPVLRR